MKNDREASETYRQGMWWAVKMSLKSFFVSLLLLLLLMFLGVPLKTAGPATFFLFIILVFIRWDLKFRRELARVQDIIKTLIEQLHWHRWKSKKTTPEN
jgi:Flp pilus assembly protein TadB